MYRAFYKNRKLMNKDENAKTKCKVVTKVKWKSNINSVTEETAGHGNTHTAVINLDK